MTFMGSPEICTKLLNTCIICKRDYFIVIVIVIEASLNVYEKRGYDFSMLLTSYMFLFIFRLHEPMRSTTQAL